MAIQVAMNYVQMRELITNSYRPRFRDNAGPNDLATNSILLRREWEALDAAVIRAFRIRTGGIADLRGAGLTSNTTLAEMLNSFRVASERARPNVTMDGRTRIDQDRTERRTYSVPIPIISTGYQFSMRELMAARAVGSELETVEAEEAAQSLSEETERILFDGNSNVVVQGEKIYGYTNHPDRKTDTAGNFGGGDFGTEHNGYKTVLGVLEAMALWRYYGPFMVYIYPTQYNQLLTIHTDGTGDKELDRILRLPQIIDVKVNDTLSAGEVVFVQMDRSVVDLRIAMDLTNVQWDNPDGSAVFFKAMLAMVPRLKPNYDTNLGVCHVTGA